MLVAVFMLFVVGGMAALSIDAVTIYTARSEAQLAADGAALAAARMLANSGMTSNAAGLTAAAETLASAVAIHVAQNSLVGGRYLVATNGEVVVSFSGTTTNPKVTVRTQRTDLPTFFARIWGSTQITVAASATAEAYNPSGAILSSGTSAPPVAPICVKPWLLPIIDPTNPASTIFGTDGSITNPSLLGWSSGIPMSSACGTAGTCTLPLNPPTRWNYYPGDQSSFPAPATALPSCSLVPAPTPYQLSIAGCVQLPISCNSTTANVDITAYGATRNGDTADAVNCLAHTTNNQGDQLTSTAPPTAPFQFLVGSDNPVAVANPALPALSDVMVSDSLVTVPVFNSTTGVAPVSPLTLVGYVQFFLQPDGTAAPDTGLLSGNINTTIVNMAGCGTNVGGAPILGNGASPVAVRLISP